MVTLLLDLGVLNYSTPIGYIDTFKKLYRVGSFVIVEKYEIKGN